MARLALESITVLDLTRAWAGPYCGKLLSDMGARIIKVEWDRGSFNPPRSSPLFPEREPGEKYNNRNGYFNMLHNNRYGVALDLSTEKGAAILKKLVKLADVMIENYSPRVMKNFGLDYPVLKEIKPDLILLSMPASGLTGPERDYVGYGIGLEQLAGLVNMTGYLGDTPHKSAVNYGDPIAGLNGAGTILAALHYRKRTGKGQHIDLSQREALTRMLGEAILDFTMNGRIQTRMENRHPLMAPHGVYRCKGEDDWVALAVSSEAEWQGLCQAMGNRSLVEDERFVTLEGRLKNQDELDRLIEAWTQKYDRFEAMEILQKHGVPAGAAMTNKDLLTDPHLKERGFFEMVAHPDAGTHPYAGTAWRMSKTPGGLRMPAPGLGQHNEYVFKDLLGMSDEEIRQLYEEEVTMKV
ncbi:MAG: CoA transferase [Candidatus Tectomicrobia bacterium]|nr:CoA transferase [Candidatus Tectomicrobia bacterium]